MPVGDLDGPTWSLANKVGTYENIGYGQNLTIEGSYPFSNSNHPGGTNMMFCDGGVRFISNTIDGTVYSKLITSSGSRLPLYAKQMPVAQDAFAQ
jgi:prepilin-type processing-associated H-X9-DG protein